MRVYLLRHGVAADAMEYDRDDDRPLTSEGRERVRRSAGIWAASGEPVPSLWIVSPLVRAVQTAEIALSAFASDAPVEIWRGLLPDARVSQAIERIEAESGPVALVGHQPLMGGIAAFLLGWSTVPAQVQPGAILAIDRDDEGGRLAWHMPPPAGGDAPRILRPPA